MQRETDVAITSQSLGKRERLGWELGIHEVVGYSEIDRTRIVAERAQDSGSEDSRDLFGYSRFSLPLGHATEEVALLEVLILEAVLVLPTH